MSDVTYCDIISRTNGSLAGFERLPSPELIIVVITTGGET